MQTREQRLGKWQAEIDMLRIVEDLRSRCEEYGMLTPAVELQIANAVCNFKAKLPQKVRDEVLHG